ncbi:uncharacterized protein ACNLHF_006283 [Anomaloglossus baeobatrachus]
MRGQPGACMVPGNYPAARRLVRSRKPPPIILWSIGIITCLLFIGAAAMLAIGYLNPFGTVGLAILGVGAVVYFGGILFLVLSCLWVERKYPGMQPLSFKIYSRKPNRIPPTTFTNPNISGQLPANTTPSYRIHHELPIEIPGINGGGGKTDKSQEKKDNNPPSHKSSSSHAENSTALDNLREEVHNGGINEDCSPDIKRSVKANNDNVNVNEDKGANSISSAGMKESSQSQQEQLKAKHSEVAADVIGMDQSKIPQHNGSENNNNVSASPKKERKVKLKTHHIEVPFEDYPSSDSSTSQSNKKNKSQDIQGSNLKDNSQHIKSTTNKENLPTTGGSKSTSLPKILDMDKQKETSSSGKNQSHATDDHSHQRTKTQANPTVKDIKQESSNQTGSNKIRFTEKDEIFPSSSQATGSSSAHERKQSPVKHQNKHGSPQRVRIETSTNSASPPATRKATEQESQAPKLKKSVQMDSSQKPSSASASKILEVHKHNATNPDQEKSQISSPTLPHKNNLRHEQQNMTTSPNRRKQNPESPDGSPTRGQKSQSPERTQKNIKNNAAIYSPQINKRAGGSSSPPRHLQKRPDQLLKEEKTKEQSTPIQTFLSSGRKEEIQNKKILHASPSSDFPSNFSSSPPKQPQRSPNKPLRQPRNGDHTSRTTALHSSPRKEEFSKRRQSLPSSQSSDIPSSPSSSLKNTSSKSPDRSTKVQGHKDIPTTNGASPSIIKKDELHSRHSQPSSSVNSSSSASSPLSAKKLLHYKKKEEIEASQKDPSKSIPQQRTNT